MAKQKCVLYVIVAIATLIGKVQAGDVTKKVGEFGNPTHWQIHGVESFTTDDVKTSLQRNFEVVLAAHPQASLSAFPNIVQQQLLLGYQSLGFPDAVANVTLDEASDRVSIVVDEGQQFLCRNVKVLGI